MKVLCIGFYGHGNAGDEAIARCLDKYLSRPFKNVEMGFSTEMSYGEAEAVNKSNAFYLERPIISGHDLERIQSPDVIIVGGGDLSGLYGAQQVLKAKESGRAAIIARIGTSAKDDFFKGGKEAVDMVRSSLRIFDHLSVRDKASFDVVSSLNESLPKMENVPEIEMKKLKPHLGADLAIDMDEDRDYKIPKRPYAVLVVREVRKEDSERQVHVAKSVYDAISREFGSVVVLPFCKADEVFSEHFVKLCKGAVLVKDAWKDPAKLKWVIANAQYVVSAGRLHPLVFAIGSRKPCYAVTYPWLNGYDKVNGFMHHTGLGNRVADWGAPPSEIGARLHDAIRVHRGDQELINVYSGHLKGLMLDSLCPILTAMEGQHGLGIERGMKAKEFNVTDYDESYYFGARLFRQPHGEFMVYHPSRGDWAGWDVIKNIIMEKMKPDSLLDVGCGRGWFLKRMVNAGVKAQGIDMSTAAWTYCVEGLQPHIKVGELNDIKHRRFDVVTVFDVMEHIFIEDLKDSIKALKESAGKYIIFNICAAPDNEDIHTIKKGEPIPQDMEWCAVSGHVTIRHRAWWKSKLEDESWESDEKMIDEWFAHPGFNFDSWARHNIIILRRRKAS